MQLQRERKERRAPLNGAGRDFPGSPVVKTLASTAGSRASIPNQGTETLHVILDSQKN